MTIRRRISNLIIAKIPGHGSLRAYRLLNTDLADLEKNELIYHYANLRSEENRTASPLAVFLLVAQAPMRAMRFDPIAYAAQNLDIAAHFTLRQLRAHFLTVGQFDLPKRRTTWAKDSRLATVALTNLFQTCNEADTEIAQRDDRREGDQDVSTRDKSTQEKWELNRLTAAFLSSFKENPLEAIIQLHDRAGCVRPGYRDAFDLIGRISRRQVDIVELQHGLAVSTNSSRFHQWVNYSRRIHWLSRGHERGPEALIAFSAPQNSLVAPTVWSGNIGEKAAKQVMSQTTKGVSGLKCWTDNSYVGKYRNLRLEAPAKERETIGIIISLYKSDRYIGSLSRQLDSLQMRDGDQVWIGICDPSDYELDEISKVQKNFQLEIFEERMGIYEVWNRGVEALDVSYLTNMNADDFRPVDSLELQHTSIELYPKADVIYSPFGYIQDLSASESWLSPMRVVKPLDFSVATILSGFNPPHSAPLWKRELHDELGYFRTDLSSASDTEFWVRALLSRKKFVVFGVPWSGYFDNPSGLSTNMSSINPRPFGEHHQILLEVYKRLPEVGLTKELLQTLVSSEDLNLTSLSIYELLFGVPERSDDGA